MPDANPTPDASPAASPTPTPEDRRAQLKRLLAAKNTTTGAPTLNLNLQPLSFSQREIWETSPVPPGDVSNHICAFLEIRGNLPWEAAEAALQRVVDRQDVMRLSILPGKDAPLQRIRPTATANINYRELTPEESKPEALEELMRQLFHEPFDLVNGPLYRVAMLKRGEKDFVLPMAIHHSIADGWSLGVYVQDLATAYGQAARGMKIPLPPVPMTYASWGAAERAQWTPEEIALKSGYWKEKLTNLPRIWDAKVDLTAINQVQNRWRTEVPAALAQQVRDLAKRTSTTLYSTLLTAFYIAFWKWNGAKDLTVGSPTANRARRGVQETMGYCAGNVPIRHQLDDSETFTEAQRRVQEDSLDAFAHAIPFAELVKVLGASPADGTTPIFEVRFALQNHPVPDVETPSMSIKLKMRSTGTARFALACEVTEETSGFEVVWLFHKTLFQRSDIETLNQHFQSVLTRVCQTPGIRIASLEK